MFETQKNNMSGDVDSTCNGALADEKGIDNTINTGTWTIPTRVMEQTHAA